MNIKNKQIISKLLENKTINNQINCEISNIDDYNIIINNIDDFASFLKLNFKLKNQELTFFFFFLILNNKNIFIINYNIAQLDKDSYINLIMKQYNKNYNLLTHFIRIKKKSYNDILKIKNKKLLYAYLGNITYNNLNYYLPIIEYYDTTN